MARQIFTAEEYHAFVDNLRSAIQERQLTVTAAARVLGITRQSLHGYLSGSSKHQPRWRVIGRACRAWDITFVLKGEKFDKRAFETEGTPETTQSSTVQLLLLPEAIDRLENANLEVKIVSKEASRICLALNVKFDS